MALDRIAPSIHHQCQSSLSAARQLSSILRSVYGRYRRLRAKCPQKHFWTARVYTRNLNVDFLSPLGCEQALLGGFEITNFFGGSMFLSPRYSPPKSLPKHAKFVSFPFLSWIELTPLFQVVQLYRGHVKDSLLPFLGGAVQLYNYNFT